MDHNTSTGWTDQKISAVQSAPPPYHNNLHLGYTQQQQGNGTLPQYGGAGQQLYTRGQQPATVVGVQPTVHMTGVPLAKPVNDYLCYSIFTLLCCCLPIGIAALVSSISTRQANSIGDQEAAERNSKSARILNHVALGLGIGIIVIAIISVVVVFTTV